MAHVQYFFFFFAIYAVLVHTGRTCVFYSLSSIMGDLLDSVNITKITSIFNVHTFSGIYWHREMIRSHKSHSFESTL